MKRLLTILLLLVVVSAPSAIVYYDDYPNQPNPPDTYILSMQTGDKSVGGTPYNFWTLNQMTAWLQLRGFTNGSSDINIITNNSFIYSTNIVVQSITNTTFVNTNTLIVTSNAFFNNTVITNVTIKVPGGETNLNLTPNSLMQSDANDAESSVPNGTGVLTNDGAGGFGWTTIVNLVGNFIDNNNGNGTNTTLWGTTIFDELDVDNAYLTNLFILVTNAPLLSTDGDGKVIAGDFLVATNNDTVVSNGLYAQITASGPANLINATNETTRQINSLTNKVAASNIISGGLVSASVMDLIRATNNDMLVTNYVQQIGDASTNYTVTATNTSAGYARTLTSQATNEVTRQINSSTNIYASLGTAISDLSIGTNLSYIIKTNNGGGNVLVSGSPGTALTCILTNITADTTLAAMTFWTAGMSVIPVYASCSGGANKILKFPANFQGSGDLYGIDLNGTGVTITNAEASWFEVRCIYGVKTNVFRSNTK